MRVFVALKIPATVRDSLAAQIKKLRELTAPMPGKQPRWMRPENLHVTLKFIGEVAKGKLESIGDSFTAIRTEAPIDLQIGGLGFFPNPNYPRVLWAGVKASANLASLAQDIDRAIEPAPHGVAQEHRTFAPHLTLARFEPSKARESRHAAIYANPDWPIVKSDDCDFGSFRAHEFHLIESTLKPLGAEYTTLASFRFTTEN